MKPGELVIEQLVDLQSLADLDIDAKADNRAMVGRFIAEWLDGRNRFDRPGERAYVAKLNGRACGVCGLNRDPFATNASVGRVRRLYVSVANRRMGIGSAMIAHLLSDARPVFDSIHLRTHDPIAAAFYESIGFEQVNGDACCTHRLPISARCEDSPSSRRRTFGRFE